MPGMVCLFFVGVFLEGFLASLEKGYTMFMLDKCPEEGNNPRHSH